MSEAQAPDQVNSRNIKLCCICCVSHVSVCELSSSKFKYSAMPILSDI